MRLALAFLAAAAVAAPLAVRAAGATSARPAAAARDTGTVIVYASCAAEQNTMIRVDPEQVHVRQGDAVAWRLADETNVVDFAISPKEKSKWPYADTPPYRGGRSRRAVASRMKQKAKGTYAYAVSVTCRVDGHVFTVDLDPDVVVDE